MNTPLFDRLALIVSATALLSACGGSSVPMGGPSSVAAGDRAPKGSKTFHYSGREQTFLVPNGVRQISVVARGAAGGGTKCTGSYCYPPDDYFGRGGRVHGIIRVRPGEILYVFVGGEAKGAAGGFNGGGSAGPGGTRGGASYGGGGASDVRAGSDTLRDRILVAAGGGGEGSSRDEIGGRGGGEIGGIGGSYCYRGSSCIGGGGGDGGAQNRGGSGGAGGFESYQPGQPGTSGTFGTGGSGGSGGCYYYSGNCDCGYANGCPGAGGGGGYYGGGGGGGGAAEYASIYGGPGGAGGGGSSWAKPGVADFRTWAGWKNATDDGLVVFTW